MSISSELRKYVADNEAFYITPYAAKCLLGIADRIDAEHEAMLADARKAVYQDYVELPKDADGVPIRVGDKLRFNNGMIVEVRYLKIDSEGTSVCVLATNGGGDFYAITDKAHYYHEPTIEDVLRELVGKVQALSNVDDEDELVTDYAKRLKLAGEDE